LLAYDQKIETALPRIFEKDRVRNSSACGTACGDRGNLGKQAPTIIGEETQLENQTGSESPGHDSLYAATHAKVRDLVGYILWMTPVRGYRPNLNPGLVRGDGVRYPAQDHKGNVIKLFCGAYVSSHPVLDAKQQLASGSGRLGQQGEELHFRHGFVNGVASIRHAIGVANQNITGFEM
jgi:hypothetical protein